MSPDRIIARAIARAIASAAAGLNGIGFLGCSTLDFIDVYLRDVESKPEGRDVGVRAAIAKKSAASNVVGGEQFRLAEGVCPSYLFDIIKCFEVSIAVPTFLPKLIE